MVELEELDELDPVSVLGDVADGGIELLGGGVVGAVGSAGRMVGDAEGDVVRSRSVPPTRSLLSVHPANAAAPSARAHTPVNNFFIVVPSSWDSIRRGGLQWGCRRLVA